MLFWIVAGTLAALVAGLLARPLLALRPLAAEITPNQAIYRDQLQEIDRDLRRGVIASAEAERARVEVARRLLNADRAGPLRLAEAPRRATLLAATVGSLMVVLGSIALYSAIGRPGAEDLSLAKRLALAEALRATRPSQSEAEAQAATMFPALEAPEDYLAMIEELRRLVPTRPDDLRGWELLALHEERLGRYAEAARAQQRVVALKGVEATADDWLGLADGMVAAAGGVVTGQTEIVFEEIAERDPVNLGLLYYLGLLEAQTGRPDRAFPLWRKVVEEAPRDNLYRGLALGQIEEVAWLAGVDYELAAPGPSAEDMSAAAEMDPIAREAMIRGMVDSLATRLASRGGPAEDWAQLVTSLVTLGDQAKAEEILAEARVGFADDAGSIEILDQAAQAAGLGL